MEIAQAEVKTTPPSIEDKLHAIYQAMGTYDPNQLCSAEIYHTDTDTTKNVWSNNQRPVMIGNVFDRYNKQPSETTPDCLYDTLGRIYWRFPLLPIERQNNDCIGYVYSLIEKAQD